MKSNVLFYPFKDDSVKGAIIDHLSTNYPLSVNELHRAIKDECKLNISYQAVHKAIKQLLREDCLGIVGNKYLISEDWIKRVRAIVEQFEASYKGNLVVEDAQDEFRIVVAKESKVREIVQERKLIGFLKELAPIYKKEFNPHNIFQGRKDHVIEYLLELQKEHEIFIAFDKGKVIGGTVLELKDENPAEKYKIWKFKHFALKKGISDKTESRIVDEVIDRLKQKSRKFKIQLNLSEKEERYINLFKKHGFTKEAMIKDRYRVGENMLIYSRKF